MPSLPHLQLPSPCARARLLGSSAWRRCQLTQVLRRPSVLTISEHCHGAGVQVLSINNSRFSKPMWCWGGGKGGGQALARGKPGSFRALPPNSRQTSRTGTEQRAALLFVWNDPNSFTFDISIIKLSPLFHFLMCSLRNACCIKQAIFNEQFNVNGF